MLRNRSRLRDNGSTLLKYFYFVSICKYLLTAGLREQALVNGEGILQIHY